MRFDSEVFGRPFLRLRNFRIRIAIFVKKNFEFFESAFSVSHCFWYVYRTHFSGTLMSAPWTFVSCFWKQWSDILIYRGYYLEDTKICPNLWQVEIPKSTKSLARIFRIDLFSKILNFFSCVIKEPKDQFQQNKSVSKMCLLQFTYRKSFKNISLLR